MKTLNFTLLLILAFTHQQCIAQNTPNNTEKEDVHKTSEYIQIKKKDNIYRLEKNDGTRFFAHGITHAGVVQQNNYTKLSELCKSTGFNSYGYGCPAPLRSDMPYMMSRGDLVHIASYDPVGKYAYVDIFDPEIQAKIEEKIQAMCEENRNNKNLIGYYWTDLPTWDLDNVKGFNWVQFTQQLTGTKHGKIAYLNFLKETYENNFEAFETIYNTESKNWNEVLNCTFTLTNTNAQTKRDNLAFLRLIARQYYAIVGNTTRKHDPNHLIFGDRYSTKVVQINEVIEEALPYIDAVAIQPYYSISFPEALYEGVHKLTKKPIVICDFACRFEEEGLKIRGAQKGVSETAAAANYVNYISSAASTGYILGSFWCNPINTTLADGQIKQGFYNTDFTIRPTLNEAVKEMNEGL